MGEMGGVEEMPTAVAEGAGEGTGARSDSERRRKMLMS